jgi:hypothetical protein
MHSNSTNASVLGHQDLRADGASCSNSTFRCPTRLVVIIAVVLCAVHLLLPIERGFPVLRIAGYPVTLTLLVSTLSMLVLFIDSNGRIIITFPKRYVPYQLLVAWIFLVSAFVSNDVEAGLFVVLSYFVTFVVDFLIVYYLFKRGLRRLFVAILCTTASIAALIGIVEAIFRYYLSFYKDWFLMYDYQAMQHAMTRSDFRVLGTLGNPIVYSVAMVLAFPFALEIRHRLLRSLVIVLLLAATIFAVSTTTLMMWLILLTGFWLTSGHKTRLTLFLVAIVVILAIFLTLQFSQEVKGYLLPGWSREFALGNQTNEQFLNLQVRYDLFFWSLARFWDGLSFVSLLFGYGLKSTIQAVKSLGLGRLSTLDSQYVTILFESGILGLVSFLAVGFNVLVGYRWAARRSLHWYSVLSLLIAGMVFTAIHYATFNFVWVASVAALAFDTQVRRSEVLLC